MKQILEDYEDLIDLRTAKAGTVNEPSVPFKNVMENTDFSFEHLELWKKARELKKEIIKKARSFPAEEKFRLTDQLIRSSRSFNSLIAEGHGRFTDADQTH